ncbi:MAG: hypothetical protein QOJ48_1069 [Frankiales bacterium]|jgi:hypothetical protein|nr:hypothetical protein [Frankiales bacterium]MDX6219388.1 hypothetical protein [Frankiales bacterium]
MPGRRADADERRQIEHVREDLAREFQTVPPDLVAELVSRQVAAFQRAPVRSFVPVLVRRGARAELRQLA